MFMKGKTRRSLSCSTLVQIGTFCQLIHSDSSCDWQQVPLVDRFYHCISMNPMIGPNGLDSRHLHVDPTCHMDSMHISLLLFCFGFSLNFTWSHPSPIKQFAVVDNIDPALKPSIMKRWCFMTNLLLG